MAVTWLLPFHTRLQQIKLSSAWTQHIIIIIIIMVMGSGLRFRILLPLLLIQSRRWLLQYLWLWCTRHSTLCSISVFIISGICDQTLPDSRSTDLNSSHLTSLSLSLSRSLSLTNSIPFQHHPPPQHYRFPSTLTLFTRFSSPSSSQLTFNQKCFSLVSELDR